MPQQTVAELLGDLAAVEQLIECAGFRVQDAAAAMDNRSLRRAASELSHLRGMLVELKRELADRSVIA